MFKTKRFITDPEKFILLINKNENYPFVSWSNSSEGWRKIIAFDPIDLISMNQGDDINTIFRFTEKYKGLLITGFINYDLGLDLKKIKSRHDRQKEIPLIQLAVYNNYIEFKGDQGIIHYQQSSFVDYIEKMLLRECEEVNSEYRTDFKANITRANYDNQYRKIIEYIKSGDIYQVNYTHQLTGISELKSNQLFYEYLKTNPVGFAAYFGGEDFNIISLSPERFISIRNRKISTYPIKGTITRGETADEDRINKRKLLASRKEQAELYMITDLLRNDIGEISKIGSVKVVFKKRIQSLSKIFHTYSKVTGDLKDNLSEFQALISMFPGGSITGCPKKRAMEIIDELEDYSRGIYTGSIGYMLPDGELDFNIAIRTIIHQGQKLNLSVGGGITLHSELEAEYNETLAKAKSFFKESQ